MIPGLLGAAGSYHGSGYTSSGITYSVLNTTPSSGFTSTRTNFTLPGTPSDSRFVIIVGMLRMLPNDDDWTFSSYSVNGVSLTVTKVAEINYPFDVSNDYATTLYVAYGTIPTGTSNVEISITLNQEFNLGLHDCWSTAIDFGAPGYGASVTADTTPNTSTGQLSVDIESNSVALMLAIWSEESGNKTSVTWSQTPVATYEKSSGDTDQTPYGDYFEIALFNVSGDYTLTATPNTHTSGEAGALYGVTAHYRP